MQQRQCLILQGHSRWLSEQALTVYNRASNTQRLYLSDSADAFDEAVPLKKATQYLGQELSLIVFDCRQAFSADSLGAIIGTLKAGGTLLLLMPETCADSLWMQRLMQMAADTKDCIQFVQQPNPVPEISFNSAISQRLPVQATGEQEQAINAVLKVVSGHRRRPLVISSDRGRGKTALLGMAAAELLKQGKAKVLVTGPAKANIETLLLHAGLQLNEAKQTAKGLSWQQGAIEFVAPDSLVKDKPSADLLIVDEAAAIPVQLLEQMLKSYSRLVFATTLHGYEGTGRGFILRFQKTLDRLTPNWRAISLEQPIRWAENDQLEQFSFDALLLNAEPVKGEQVHAANSHNVRFEIIPQSQLIQDETLLRQVFGLMVLAHYRTRPSDLQMMLDRNDISIAVLRYQGQVVATAWLVEEPAMETELASQVFEGTRRLKGQLLPQSLLAHAGIPDAGQCHYQRIIRIAVHPELQSRGLGSHLLQQVKSAMKGKTDMIGTSFAMDERVIPFWLNNGLRPVRLGQHPDQITGSIAVLMLEPVSDKGQALFVKAEQLLSQQWPFLLQRQLNSLPVKQVICLTQSLSAFTQIVTDLELLQIKAFAFSQRNYESTEIALWKWLSGLIGQALFTKLESHAQAVLIKVVMQHQDINDVVASLGLNGLGEVIKALRQAVSDCLSLVSSLETK